MDKYSLSLKLRWIWQCRVDFTQFSLNIRWNNNNRLHTRLVQTTFNIRTLDFDNYHQSFGSWSIARIRTNVSWLSWSNSRLACNSADHCLKFCDNIICCNTRTLNNQHDLRPDSLAVSFPVQWTRTHWSAGKRQCSALAWTVYRRSVMLKWGGGNLFDNRRMSGSNLCSIRYLSNTQCLF